MNFSVVRGMPCLLKIEKILFYAFIFLIPLQIRTTISWQGSEWSSIFLYLTDLLLVGVFIFAIINTKLKGLRFKKSDFILILFFLVAAISLFKSVDLGNSAYRLVKLLEFAILYVYIMYRKEFLGLNGILRVIFASGVFQAILAIAQFYKQGSLGLKFIEAGSYAPGEAGVATFISGTEKVMRAYGSFPHPNVLAAFLLLAIFCFYALWLKSEKPRGLIGPIGPIGLMGLIFALFLTFSRGTILVFVFVSFAFFIFRFFQLRAFYHTDERLAMGKKMMILALFFVIFSVISALLVLPYFKTRFIKISLGEEAIDLRFFYSKMAFAMIKEKPFLGIGMGNFANYSREFPAYIRAANKIYNSGGFTGKEIPEWLYQPAHNIYLLIASEIGILGALIFIVFLLIKFFKNIKPMKPKELSELIGPMIFLFAGFLVLGLNDHYFWTLQSGGIIFWLVLALISHNTQHVTRNN
jgi:O-antigen ligase